MAHPDYTIGEWEHADTDLGYAEWVQYQIETAPSDFDLVADLAAHEVLSIFQIDPRAAPETLALLVAAIADIMGK